MKGSANTERIVKAAVIASAYCLISLLLKPLSFGPLQLRAAEALSMLVLFTKAAPWGLFAGCLLTNIISPYGLLDMLLGSFATLIAALMGARIKNRYLAGIPFVVVNALLVALVICIEARAMGIYFETALYLALSEALSIYLLGIPLSYLIEKNEKLNGLIADK